MDYETRATNRKEVRLYAKMFRVFCGFTQSEVIDPIRLLERLSYIDIFKNVFYEIVEDCKLPGKVPARCIPTENGYLIQIKESVYMGAFERNIGGYQCILCMKLFMFLRI